MKLALSFLAVIAVSALTASSVPVGSDKSAREHLKDFLDLLPTTEIETLFAEYLTQDEDFAVALDYLLSEPFRKEVAAFEGAVEFKDYLDFLEKIGLKAYETVNKFNDLLGIEHVAPLGHPLSSRLTGGLNGFFKDLKALLPSEAIQKLYEDKIANAPEFAKLIKQLNSEESGKLFGKLMTNRDLEELLEKAEGKGVDINAILDFLGSIFGFKFPHRPAVSSSTTTDSALLEHFADFLKLVPTDKIEELFYEYLNDDEDFAVVLDYLLGEEFKAQLESIEKTAEFKAELTFFERYGVPAYEAINKLNDFLGIGHVAPLGHPPSSRLTGGLSGFFKDIKALLPIEAIQKLYNEKVATAPEFAEFVKAVESEEFFGLVSDLLANKDVEKLVGKAEARGVDFEAIIDFIGSIFGFEFPKP